MSRRRIPRDIRRLERMQQRLNRALPRHRIYTDDLPLLNMAAARMAASRVSVRLDCGCPGVSLNGDTPKPLFRYRSCQVHGRREPGPDVAVLERLLAQGTKTPSVPGAMDAQNRIDRRLLLRKYGSMENILPPELDALRPRAPGDWSQE